MNGEHGKLLDRHEVGTVVIGCIDFRFRKQVPGAVLKAFGVDDYDDSKLAGGAKNIASPDKPGRQEAILDDIELVLDAHHAHQAILLNHQNCGKYAKAGHTFFDPAAERDFHLKELRLAGDIVFRHFPNVKILLGYVYVDKNDTVHIESVKSSTV